MGIRETAAKGLAPERSQREYFPPIEDIEEEVRQAQVPLDWDDDPAQDVKTYKEEPDIQLELNVIIPNSKLPEMTSDNYDQVYAKAEQMARDEVEALCGPDVDERYTLKYDMQDYSDYIEVMVFIKKSNIDAV